MSRAEKRRYERQRKLEVARNEKLIMESLTGEDSDDHRNIGWDMPFTFDETPRRNITKARGGITKQGKTKYPIRKKL